MVYSDFFILEQFPRLTKVCDFWRIVLGRGVPVALSVSMSINVASPYTKITAFMANM